jgi:hypothetical protein
MERAQELTSPIMINILVVSILMVKDTQISFLVLEFVMVSVASIMYLLLIKFMRTPGFTTRIQVQAQLVLVRIVHKCGNTLTQHLCNHSIQSRNQKTNIP